MKTAFDMLSLIAMIISKKPGIQPTRFWRPKNNVPSIRVVFNKQSLSTIEFSVLIGAFRSNFGLTDLIDILGFLCSLILAISTDSSII